MQFQGAIFDLDGTLLDSMGVWEDIDRTFLGRRGIPVPPDYMDKVAALSFPAAAVYTIERFALQETPESLMEEWSDMARDAYAHRVPLKAGAGRLSGTAEAQRGEAGGSNGFQRGAFSPGAEAPTASTSFRRLHHPEGGGPGQGISDIYLRAAEKLGLTPDTCVVFEDLAAGIAGAKAGGFCAVGVYDKHAAADRDTIIGMADAYLASLEEAWTLL